ncbi:PDDEXK family nuclease [Candidatus Nitrosocosmicus sp. T]
MSYSRFGREAEYAAGSCLNNYGWAVFFSKGSRGPADIIASRDNTLLLIQVKSSTKIPKIRGAEVHNLIQMSEKISNSYPLLSLVHPHLECNVNNNTILFGNYLINFFILPRWDSVDFLK